jgi:signal peptidase I
MNEIDEVPVTAAPGDPADAASPLQASNSNVRRKADDDSHDSGSANLSSSGSPAPDASAQAKPGTESKKKGAERESFVELVKTIGGALLIALAIRTFLFQPFNIPSGSMEATLLIGDYLFVEKFAYGYSRYSFPWGLGPIPQGRIWQGAGPKRGDVVVFKLPSDNSTDYIKRVIGLPGDRIQLIDGQIYLNDKPVSRVRVSDYIDTDPLGAHYHVARYRETLPSGRSYLVLAREPLGADNNTGVYVVPPGHYFMMGDNRDNSLDSRFAATGKGDAFDRPDGVGFVPAANLVGKAEFIFFSYDGQGWELLEFWHWPWSIRFSRMFTTID